MGRSKLRAALAAEKGVDFEKLKQKKLQKNALQAKRKAGKLPPRGAKLAAGQPSGDQEDDEGWEDDEEDEEGDGSESGDESNGEGNPLIDDIAEEEDEDDDDDEEKTEGVFIGAFDDSESSSDSDVEMEEKIERTTSKTTALPNGKTPKQKPLPAKKASKVVEDDDDEDDEEDEEDEDVAWSDLDEHDDDLIPHQKLTINNTTALLASLKRIQIPTDGSAPFVSHQSIVGRAPTADAIPDVQDDLARELQFYAQSLDAARRARALLLKEGVPFSRPTDYFAEMIKDDPHMDKVKSRLVADASAKKAASEARKQRDLKKFGKQVQVAKLQERQKAKKDTLDKIKTLKRKRQESSGDLPTREADLFDVAVDDELKGHRGKPGQSSGKPSRGGRGGDRRGADGAPNPKRQRKNEKFGFGGKKRHGKSGDALSSGDLSGFSARRMKGGALGGGRGGGKAGGVKASRPGKARRKAAAGKR